MTVDVLFIKPDFNDIAVMPPIGLGYLSAILRNKGMPVAVHDNTLLRYDDARLGSLVRELKPKVVGLYAATPMIRRAEAIVKLVREIDPGILTVLGGPHPTCTAPETLQFCDVVVIGEGEETLPELMDRFLGGSRDFTGIRGCAFKDMAGEVRINPPREILRDLDAVPFPDFQHMPIELYLKNGNTYGITQRTPRSLPIMASRGCPSTCTFCQRFLGKKFRVRSAANIVDELAFWKEKYRIDEFNFLDDNFTLVKKHVLDVCEMIHQRGLNIKFRFPNGVREDFLDEEILDALKSVGCYHLDFGIESGSQKVLDIMKKGKQLSKIVEKVYLCKKAGFKVSSSFLFGTPGETLADMEETIRFAVSLPLDSACFSLVMPFPGTEIRAEAIQKGYLVHSDYEDYTMSLDNIRPALATPDWNGEDILRMIRKANRRFFVRPKQVLKLLPSLVNPVNIKRYVVSFLKTLR